LHLPDLLHVHHFYGSDGCLAEPEGSEREGGGKTLAERGRGEESRGGGEREQRRELEKRRRGEVPPRAAVAWAAASRAGLTRAEGKGAGWPALGGRRQGAGWIWPEGGRADLAGDGARTGGGVLGRWRRRIGQGSGGVRETGGFSTDSFFLFL